MSFRIHSSNTSKNLQRMFDGEMRVYDNLIAPRIHPLIRPLHRIHTKGKYLGQMSIRNREQNKPHLADMMFSLATAPLGEWWRYKVGLHMLLKNARIIR
jgi:hypothetical protein